VKITVASGKGGTGKTTVATSLALSLAAGLKDGPAQTNSADSVKPLFLDCDVEAPNAHFFLEPAFQYRKDVSILIPEVNEDACTHCGRCAEVCQWHAIAVLGQKLLVFPQLCHGCGSCTLICPEGTLYEVPNPIGVIEGGPARDGVGFVQGVLNIGEPMSVPIIRELKKLSLSSFSSSGPSQADADRLPDWLSSLPARQTVIIDASPGTTCPVVESMRGVDFCLLVTEPTPFGLHDLRLAVQVAQELNVPVGVIVNRDGVGDSGVDDYCREQGLPVLMRIPLDQRIAEGIARGIPLLHILPEYGERFRSLYDQIEEIVTNLKDTLSPMSEMEN